MTFDVALNKFQMSVTVLEVVQSLSQDVRVAGEARRGKEEECGCDPVLLEEEG